MPKSKTSAKKPERAGSAKPVKAAKAVKSVKTAKPVTAAKPAKAGKAPAKIERPVAPAKTERPAAPAKKAARPNVVAAPAPIPIVTRPAAQAPGKFRREYRRWKDLLITLRHRLLAEGSHLEEEGLKALEQEVSVDHMADFGSDSSEQETTLQLIESNSLSLRDVDDALKRIEAGSFGLCEDCEELIPVARLGVIPHARFCISCQSKREGMPA